MRVYLAVGARLLREWVRVLLSRPRFYKKGRKAKKSGKEKRKESRIKKWRKKITSATLQLSATTPGCLLLSTHDETLTSSWCAQSRRLLRRSRPRPRARPLPPFGAAPRHARWCPHALGTFAHSYHRAHARARAISRNLHAREFVCYFCAVYEDTCFCNRLPLVT